MNQTSFGRVLLAVASCLVLFTGYGQASKSDSVTLFVYFLKGVDQQYDSLARRSSFALTSQLRTKLDSAGGSEFTLEKAFAEFNERDTIEYRSDGEPVKSMNLSKVFRLRLSSDANVAEVVKRLQEMPEVLYVHGASSVTLDHEPTEAACGSCGYQSQQDYFDNQVNPTWDINARQAWNIYRGKPGRIVGVFDTGIQSDHPDLDGKVSGATGITNEHGTNMAGIIAAITNNPGVNGSMAGVNWFASLYSQLITGDDGDMNSRMRNMAQNSAIDVINNSFGLTNEPQNGAVSWTIKEGYAYAYERDKVLVASSGNHQDTDPYIAHFPSGWDNQVIAVAGAGGNFNTVRLTSGRHNSVDLTAPGTGIYTTDLGSGWESTGGTSGATAMVSGVASLIKGMRPDLCSDDVRNLLYVTAQDIVNVADPDLVVGWDIASGHGLINAEAALDLLLEPNELIFRTSTGGTIVSSTSQFTAQFLGVHPNLSDGHYTVKRHEVQKTVNVQNNFNPVDVWGRGYYSVGYSPENPNFGSKYTEVVSFTGSSITLKTYIYEVWSLLGQEIGVFPTSANNVKFAWAELYTEPGTAYDDGFENGLRNAYNSTGDDLNWEIRSGGTPSSGTGPSGAFEGSDYLYVEASSPNFPSKNARLQITGFEGLGKYRVRFKYHMYGADQGTLSTSYNKGNGLVYSNFSTSGDKGNQWLTYDRSLYDMRTLTIEATTGSGYRSDIAIDDLEIIRLEDHPVQWTDVVNVSDDQSSVLKTSGITWWNAGAASANVVPGYAEGWIETTITDYEMDFMVGLSYTNDDAFWNTIDFNLYVSKYRGNEILVYNRGTEEFSGRSYAVGDRVAVHRHGSTVYFLHNGYPFYSLSCDQSKSMIGDISMYNGNMSMLDVRMNFSAGSSAMAFENTHDWLRNPFTPIDQPSEKTSIRPVGNDHPMDTVTQTNLVKATPDLFRKFNVYPNESRGTFNVDYTLNEHSQLILLIKDNITGQVLYQEEITDPEQDGEISFDISHLEDNTYFLEMNNLKQKHVVRIIKSTK